MTLELPFALERLDGEPASWMETHKGHARLVELADRHYTRQKPGTNQFCRPGKNLCFLLSDGTAGWATWRPIPEVGRMDNLEAWECTLFRNEGQRLSSELIVEATALTYREWGWPPRDGLITGVGIEETASGRSPYHQVGWCYLKAGWTATGRAWNGKAWFRAPHPMKVPR